MTDEALEEWRQHPATLWVLRQLRGQADYHKAQILQQAWELGEVPQIRSRVAALYEFIDAVETGTAEGLSYDRDAT